MKNALEAIISRITGGEEWVCDLKDRMVETSAVEQNKEKWIKINEDNLRNLWDIVKCANIQITGVPEK